MRDVTLLKTLMHTSIEVNFDIKRSVKNSNSNSNLSDVALYYTITSLNTVTISLVKANFHMYP